MSSFRKYHSIEMISRFTEIERYRDVECVGIEKIHGTNISVTIQGDNFIVAKRNSITNPNDKNDSIYILAVEKIREKVLSLREYIGDNFTIYGELFGGYYQGYKSDCIKIQKEVQYTPNHEIMFYDIWVDDKFLDYDEMIDTLSYVGLLSPPLMIRGTLDEVLNYNIHRSSVVAAYYDLPILFELNLMEGIIVRPTKEIILEQGDRFIFKIKNVEFMERSRQKIEVSGEYNDIVKETIDRMSEFVTIQRADNIRSHGHKSQKEAFSSYLKDIISDYTKEYSFDLPKVDRDNVMKEITRLARSTFFCRK